MKVFSFLLKLEGKKKPQAFKVKENALNFCLMPELHDTFEACGNLLNYSNSFYGKGAPKVMKHQACPVV